IVNETKITEYYLIDEKINKSFSSMDTPPGIAAVYSKPGNKIDHTKPIVYLNAINDPGNVGTILRSALAFDLQNIVIDERSADVYNPKTISAAKDAIFKLNIGFDKDRKFLIDLKKMSAQGGPASGWPIFTTRLEKSNGLEILNKQKLFCIVLGSESHGVDEAIRKMSDDFIRIPMSANIESLNVAASAAIIFHEIYNNRKN
ncbi:MAG: RNA methyltransferase, partial [Candidatus Paceibacterota bacterium]